MPVSHNTPALGGLAAEAASFSESVADNHTVTHLDIHKSSLPTNKLPGYKPGSSSTSNPSDSESNSQGSGTPITPGTPPTYPLIHRLSDAPTHLGLSGRIINVLANLPHQVYRDPESGQFNVQHRRGNSALYSALADIHSHPEWTSFLVGWTGEIRDSADSSATASTNTSSNSTAKDEIDSRSLSGFQKSSIEASLNDASRDIYGEVGTVWLEGDSQDYRAYAENIIWPILHYIQGQPTDGVKEQDWWRRYVALNEAFAERVAQMYRPGDIVWIHDYYLFLLPQLLRMRMPKAYVAMFLHSPFPSSEYFRVLPRRKDLLEGMLGANLVATQSYNFSRHFISACTRLLSLESRPTYISAYGVHVSVDTIPIGIDAVAVERDAFSPDIGAKVSALHALYPGKKLIIGRDRLDSVRGVVQKLYAYEMFLTLYPEWVGKVVLIQVTSPAYFNAAKTDKKIAEMIAKINGTYGTLDYSPIQHYPRHIAREEYLALLRAADLGLITSVRDGMNTTSLEFVVCQKDKHSPLVLSEFTGTAGLLVDSIQVNPWDSIGVAQTINQCLSQSSERNSTIEGHLYKTVTSNTVQDWVTRNISRLIYNLARHDQSFLTPTLDRTLLAQKYKVSKNRLFMFDYDGTLTPIVREPSAAIPSARLYKSLELLTKDPHNHVWIISGRDCQFLDKWLGLSSSLGSSLGFSAEHGCFYKDAGSSEWINLAEKVDMSWREDALRIFNYFTERTQGSHIELKQAAITWHHRRADPEFGIFQAIELKKQLEKELSSRYDVEIMQGKANIEVRPRQFNKGEIVKQLIRRYTTIDANGRSCVPDFIYCSGDDKTDEDMFKAVRSEAKPYSAASLSTNPSSSSSSSLTLEHNSSSVTLSSMTSLNEDEDVVSSELQATLGRMQLPVQQQQRVTEKNARARKAAYERGSADGIFSVTVGPANKRTNAAWHLADPDGVLETLSILTGETSLQDVPGMGE